MTRLAFACLFAALISFVHPAHAGQFNPVLNIGDAAPAWSNLPGTDGKSHSLADLKDKDAVVVVFTCNSCPVAADYEDRIIAMAKKFADPQGKAAVVAINVNKIPEDSLEKMRERAEAKGFPFPYLFDESQKIAKDYGATFTPEFFVLNRERKIVYMGGMDDNSNPAEVKTNYLDAGIEAAIAGSKPATTETVARGCMIRYARERRRN
ncbi:MAG TPA: thioredoxin family protein [Pirellulales bacterium]|jgi:peroxiredoxin|nr:thioredoxin family protein [Pirellulales bacterium]